MIPVVKQEEPKDFNKKVRIPGQRFLQTDPSPSSRQLQRHNYWRYIKEDLYNLYANICAYTGEWIPVTSASVDHFIPKSKEPQLAYEWDNYRLTTGIMNNNKGEQTDIIDPFDVHTGWFVLVLPSCDIKPCTTLDEIDSKRVDRTINILKLNSYDRTNKRYGIIQAYIRNDITFDLLQRKYPYIAFELERQGVRETISDYFKTKNKTLEI
ncbi:MAG: hypothetical protein LBT00_01235 [Spirochaetaceae bacterium]|nr:hypothetical protein [Spirochaetaceae bacterium]